MVPLYVLKYVCACVCVFTFGALMFAISMSLHPKSF